MYKIIYIKLETARLTKVRYYVKVGMVIVVIPLLFSIFSWIKRLIYMHIILVMNRL